VHDRRIDGVTHTFGNAGTLFMNAMTWYDHETQSIWSQPWGRAIIGEFKGIQLHLLPFQLTTWETWKSEHPETLVMINDQERVRSARQGFNPDFVIGLILEEDAKAYYFNEVKTAGVINDTLGNIPIVIWVDGNKYHAYVRQVGQDTLTYKINGEEIIDIETGSIWHFEHGVAIDGPLLGEGLQQVPSLSSYDWAWLDFYPESQIYSP
jgi:hypothetical protein